MIKILYIKQKYPEKRNIINKINNRECFYIKNEVVKKPIYLIKRLYLKLRKRSNWDIDGIYKHKKYIQNGVIHTFNTVCITPNAWCVSFESIVPRIGATIERPWEKTNKIISHEDENKINYLLDCIRKENCLNIIAISKSAYNLQRRMLEELNIKAPEEIFKKMVQIYPPQKLLINKDELYEKFKDIKLMELIFISNPFFLKGGKEIIDVLSQLHKYYTFHLTVVSNFSITEHYVSKKESDYYRKMMEKCPWITIYSNVSNDKVIELCRKAHVGLLPSYKETFGYSLLEMQAAGVPVISTNIRAYPELNNNECGWIIELKIDEFGEAYVDDANDLEENKAIVRNSLNNILSSILKNNDLYKKALKCTERILLNHNERSYEVKLKEIYSKKKDYGI